MIITMIYENRLPWVADRSIFNPFIGEMLYQTGKTVTTDLLIYKPDTKKGLRTKAGIAEQGRHNRLYQWFLLAHTMKTAEAPDDFGRIYANNFTGGEAALYYLQSFIIFTAIKYRNNY
jgi:hypothetical protein